MSDGVLIFAFDNEKVDYVTLADFAAARVKSILGLQTALVTDNSNRKVSNFDHVISVYDYESETHPNQRVYQDFDHKVLSFKNFTRTQAFKRSPFDRTILLDADYLVNSKHLLKAFEMKQPYLISKDILTLTGKPVTPNLGLVNFGGIPTYWATAVYFDKSRESARLFETVEYVKENWPFYSARHKFPNQMYRNDFAFAVAIHLLNGRQTFHDRQFPVQYRIALMEDTLGTLHENYFAFYLGREKVSFVSTGFDVHVMNKRSLLKCIQEIKDEIEAIERGG